MVLPGALRLPHGHLSITRTFPTLRLQTVALPTSQMFAAWVAFWIVAWIGVSSIAHRLPRATRDDENTPQWIAQVLLAFVRAVFVSTGATFSPSFAFLNHCGYSFFSFEIIDLFISLWYGLLGKDMLLHHAIHILAGGLMWGFGLHELARPVMMQEWSSIPLNLFVFSRNRPQYAHLSTSFFVCFAIAFAIFRLGGGTIAAVSFFFGGTHPVLGTLILAGASMQWYWGYTIALKVRRQLSNASESKRDA